MWATRGDRHFQTKSHSIIEENQTDHPKSHTTTSRTTGTDTGRITNQNTDTKKNHLETPPTVAQKVNSILPVFLLTNIQSFGNSGKTDKSTEIEAVLEVNNIDIACFTETWLNEETKDQVSINNYVNFHLVRRNTARVSGGVSILVKNHIPTSKLEINVPEHIECLWITARPKWLPRAISNIVVAGIYYPGSNSSYAPNQEDILLHITETVQQLYKIYVNPLFVLMGDFNDLCVDDICNSCNLNQVVKIPTRKNATLDLILTNSDNKYYKDPVSLPNIGKSDHQCVLYEPIANRNIAKSKSKTTTRIFHKSAIMEFGSWLTKFNWNIFFIINDVNQKIAYLFILCGS